MSELPSFTLSYSPQQNFIKRALTAVFSENEYAVDSVRIIDALGDVITVPVDVEYYDDKTWTVQFLEQPQKMVPGKYTVELVINENETLYTDSFEFYWGVLAVNTTKSMYFPGEDVTLNLAALTEKGDTICDIFCGSGTALVESRLSGRNSYGIDLNPLAAFLAKAKTSLCCFWFFCKWHTKKRKRCRYSSRI